MSCGEVCIANRRLDTTSLAQQCKEGFRSGVGSPSACGVAMLPVAIQVREAARQNCSQLGPWMTAAFILISAPGFAGKRCWVELSARLASSRLGSDRPSARPCPLGTVGLSRRGSARFGSARPGAVAGPTRLALARLGRGLGPAAGLSFSTSPHLALEAGAAGLPGAAVASVSPTPAWHDGVLRRPFAVAAAHAAAPARRRYGAGVAGVRGIQQYQLCRRRWSRQHLRQRGAGRSHGTGGSASLAETESCWHGGVGGTASRAAAATPVAVPRGTRCTFAVISAGTFKSRGGPACEIGIAEARGGPAAACAGASGGLRSARGVVSTQGRLADPEQVAAGAAGRGCQEAPGGDCCAKESGDAAGPEGATSFRREASFEGAVSTSRAGALAEHLPRRVRPSDTASSSVSLADQAGGWSPGTPARRGAAGRVGGPRGAWRGPGRCTGQLGRGAHTVARDPTTSSCTGQPGLGAHPVACDPSASSSRGPICRGARACRCE